MFKSVQCRMEDIEKDLPKFRNKIKGSLVETFLCQECRYCIIVLTLFDS